MGVVCVSDVLPAKGVHLRMIAVIIGKMDLKVFAVLSNVLLFCLSIDE